MSELFVLANHLEAALWSTIGLVFLLQWVRGRTRQMDLLVAAVTFFAFGISDLIEARTGAWWRPLGLLALKAFCLLIFMVLLARYMLRRKGRL